MSECRQKALAPWFILVGAAVSGVAVLFFFDPVRSGFYPVCYFHKLTGLLCPGCGGLRAMHQLLHGNLAAALRLNALFVVSLPFLGWASVSYLIRRSKQPSAAFELRPQWLWAGLLVLLVFSVVRNLA